MTQDKLKNFVMSALVYEDTEGGYDTSMKDLTRDDITELRGILDSVWADCDFKESEGHTFGGLGLRKYAVRSGK